MMKNKIKGLTQKQTKKMRLVYLSGILYFLDKELQHDPNLLASELWINLYKMLKEHDFDFNDLPEPLACEDLLLICK